MWCEQCVEWSHQSRTSTDTQTEWGRGRSVCECVCSHPASEKNVEQQNSWHITYSSLTHSGHFIRSLGRRSEQSGQWAFVLFCILLVATRSYLTSCFPSMVSHQSAQPDLWPLTSTRAFSFTRSPPSESLQSTWTWTSRGRLHHSHVIGRSAFPVV